MVAAENFVTELDAKNQASIQRVIDALSGGWEGRRRGRGCAADALKAAIEPAEVAALWITDCDDLEMKLSLAEQCGDSARQCRQALGAAGRARRDRLRPARRRISKLFAFLRSLQTTEERSSAGYVTGKALSMARLGALGGILRAQGRRRQRPLARRRDHVAGAAVLRRGKADAGRGRRDRGEPGARAARRVPDPRARRRDRRAAAAAQGARQKA